MAITHHDLSVRNLRSTDISSTLALFLVVFSVLCGVVAFILCLAAEGSRSEVTWLLMSSQADGKSGQCFYSSSGRTPLACAVAAFLLLAVAMFAEHAYMLVAITSPKPPTLSGFTVRHDSLPSSRDLTWQICCLFVTTWICFALAEVLLMIGLGVESGHLRDWRNPRSICHAIRPGVFAVAGVLGLITVFLGVGLYLTALRSQRLHLEEGNARRQGGIPDASSHQIQPSAPQVPHTMMMGAHQSQHRREPDKTSTSA